jgi:hypothetical protein
MPAHLDWFLLHQENQALLEAVQQNTKATLELQLEMRRLQAAQAATYAEMLHNRTAMQRLQRQEANNAVLLTSMVCKGLRDGQIAVAAPPAEPATVRAATTQAGKRRLVADEKVRKKQKEYDDAIAAGERPAGERVQPKWQRWQGVHHSLAREYAGPPTLNARHQEKLRSAGLPRIPCQFYSFLLRLLPRFL